MMDVYLDTEFNGFGGELLSIALVPADPIFPGFYGELLPPERIDPWVAENVIPKMDGHFEGKRLLRLRFHEWLRKLQERGGFTVYADWYTDLAHFFSLFAGDDHFSSAAVYCRAVLVNAPDLGNDHHAFRDAQKLHDWHQATLKEPTP